MNQAFSYRADLSLANIQERGPMCVRHQMLIFGFRRSYNTPGRGDKLNTKH